MTTRVNCRESLRCILSTDVAICAMEGVGSLFRPKLAPKLVRCHPKKTPDPFLNALSCNAVGSN